MVALATAFVRLRPEPGTGFQREAEKQVAGAGTSAGKQYGSEFTRGADGKLRDARGKFVTDSEAAGGKAGKKAGTSFAAGLKENMKGAAAFAGIAGVGAAVLAIGKIGVAYEDNLAIFQAVTKASAGQMGIIAAKARALGADMTLPGVSAAGAAAAMTELAKGGFSVAQAMDAAKGTLQLARAATISEAQAAEIAANAVNAFGIKASDVGFVVDQLAAAANSSSIEVTDAADSFKMAAAVFSSFQGAVVGPKEAITALNTAVAILGNAGIKGSDAGTSLKQMLLQLAAPSLQAKDIMKELALRAQGATISLAQQNAVLHGSNAVRKKTLAIIAAHNKGMKAGGDIAYDASGRMRPLREIISLVAQGTKSMTQEQRNFAVTTIFGADASRAVLALMKAGLPVYDKQRKAVMAAGAAADVAAAKNKGLKGAIDNVRSQMENTAISIFNVVKGPLTTALNGLAARLPAIFAGIGSVFSFLGRHMGLVKAVAAALLVLVVATKLHTAAMALQAAGGMLAWLTTYAKGTRIAAAATKAWAAAQWLFNAALTANPIGIVIVAVAALVVGIIIAYKQSATFREIVQAAWRGIQAAVSFAWNNVIKPALAALVWYYRNIVGPVVMWLWRNIIAPAFKGIGVIIGAAWVVIKVIFAAIQFYIRNVLAPVFTWLWNNVVKPVWAGISLSVKVAWAIIRVIFGLIQIYIKAVLIPMWKQLWGVVKVVWAGISLAIRVAWVLIRPIFGLIVAFIRNVLVPTFRWLWNTMRAIWNGVWMVIQVAWARIRPILAILGTFIRDKVVPAFRTGVNAITTAWDKLREAARKPVVFVVNSVINPLIRGFNRLAGVFGVGKVGEIGGFASGGRIPGAPSRKDNRLAAGPGGLLKVATGEFVTNAMSTAKNLPLVAAINRKRGKVTRQDVDPYLDGMADGGLIGKLWGKAKTAASSVWDAVTNPAELIKGPLMAALGRIPGGGAILDTVKGMGRKLVDGLMGWVGKTGGGALGGGMAGGWRRMQSLIAGQFPGLGLISGFRRGSRTLSGSTSYHASGRAVDYPPSRALAAWIRGRFGANTKELITPFQDLNLHNGRPHTYTGAVWNQHNFAGGNAHVHWAMALGGLIDKLTGLPPVRSFDSGGAWPTDTLGYNGSGRTEFVHTGGGARRGGDIHAHFHGPVGSQRELKDWFVKTIDQLRRERRL